MIKNVDVVVVGAGNAGLTAAAATARMGLSTLLLERHNIPGGCATSFRRGRFEFEPSLHEMADYGSAEHPGNVRRIFDELGLKVEILPVKDAFRTIVTGPQGYDVTAPVGIENFVRTLEREVPGSAESVTNFFKLARDVGGALRYLSKGQPDLEVLQRDHLNFMKVAHVPTGPVLDELKMPEKAQQILMTYWPYMGTPRSQFPFLLYSIMVYRYISMGAYIPVNRSHDMSLALEQALRDHGGEVWYNTEVCEILVQAGRCRGVRTRDGSEIHARQVIANFYPHRAFAGMVPRSEVPERALKLANARTLGMSGFCVYLGLDRSPEELGIRDYSVFISDTPDSDEQQKGMFTLEKNNYLVMNCLNIDLPGCSPEGTSILWATQLYAPGAWDEVRPAAYRETKNRLAQKVIDIYEKATGIIISDCIEEISISTPATFARYLDTPAGSFYGYHGAGWDAMLPRIMGLRGEQWIKGLHFAGGHGSRTMGYSSTYINGHQTAQLAAQQIREGQ